MMVICRCIIATMKVMMIMLMIVISLSYGFDGDGGMGGDCSSNDDYYTSYDLAYCRLHSHLIGRYPT